MEVKSYVVAKTCEEAYQLLQDNVKNKVLGGGAWLKISVKNIEQLISLEALNLQGIDNLGKTIRIGAMETLRDIETNSLVNNAYSGILSQAISKIMGLNIRNLATIGGSIMGRFSFSDLLPVLLVLDASLEFHHHGKVKIQDFLESREYLKDVLKSVTIKNHTAGGYFKKVATTALDFSIVNLAIVKDDEFKIAVGSRPGLALLAKKTMAYLNQQKEINEDVIDKASQIAIEELGLGDNLRGSKSYREILVKTYIKRGLRQVVS